jgi:LysR family transcriptional regulator, hydrogen peroxide-inducible genes activator
MNIQQLEYIIAVDNYRHFATAAEKSFVTQPTLSMMIQKLEDELNVKIFDRSKHPVIPTVIGEKIISQARKIIYETQKIKEIAKQSEHQITGELRLGIIPTLAPYLLPLFIKRFIKKYPLVKLIVSEMITEQIIEQLKKGSIDAGLLVTPLHEKSIKEMPLFYESFLAYVSEKEKTYSKKYLLPADINPDNLWLLEEGHCFRSQILNLCELKKAQGNEQFEYAAGSIETLIKFVEQENGITIIPELAGVDMSARQRKHLREFKAPVPVREVSMVVHRSYYKENIIDALNNEIQTCLPENIKKSTKNKLVIKI